MESCVGSKYSRRIHSWKAGCGKAAVGTIDIGATIVAPVTQRGLALVRSIRLAIPVERLEEMTLVVVGAHGANVGHVIDESGTKRLVIIAGAAPVRQLDRQYLLSHEISRGIEARIR